MLELYRCIKQCYKRHNQPSRGPFNSFYQHKNRSSPSDMARLERKIDLAHCQKYPPKLKSVIQQVVRAENWWEASRIPICYHMNLYFPMLTPNFGLPWPLRPLCDLLDIFSTLQCPTNQYIHRFIKRYNIAYD